MKAQIRSRQISKKLVLFVVAVVVVLASFMTLLRGVLAAPGDYSYGYQIGAAAMGQYPRLVATASDGTVYVEDNQRNELVHFSADGTVLDRVANWGYSYAMDITPDGVIYRTTYDTIERRSGDGTLLSSFALSSAYAHSIAVDPSGNVYVASHSNNHAVVVYNAAGTQIATIGTGSAGSADGQFNYVMDVAVHGGEVYVADYYNNRVQVFAPDGTFLRKFTTGSYPRVVAVSPTGEVLVGRQSNTVGENTVAVYSSTGTPLTSFGPNAYEREDGTIYSFLADLAVGPTGNVYVVDGASRLQQFTAGTYAFQRELITADDPEHGLYEPYQIARDKDGNIYVFDYDNWLNPDAPDQQHRVIQKYSATGTLIDTITIRTEYQFDDGAGNYHNWYVSPYNGMQIDADGNIYFAGHHGENTQDGGVNYAIAKYAPNGGNPELLVNCYEADEYDLNAYSFQLDPSTGDFWFSGYMYDYADNKTYNIARVSPGGGQPEFLLERNQPDGSYVESYYGLALGQDGQIYLAGQYYDVTDPANPRDYSVFRVDRDGNNLIGLIAREESLDGGLHRYTHAYQLGLDKHGNVYVGGWIEDYDTTTGTYTQHVVAKYTSDGEFIGYIAQYGTEDEGDHSGISSSGSAMLVDPNGNVYALDQSDKVVKVYLIEPDLPTAPRNLAANPDATSIMITWQPPESDGNAPIESYIVRVREPGGQWVTVATLPSGTLQYTLTSLDGRPLKQGVAYEFEVLARNSAGDSPIARTSAQLAVSGVSTTNPPSAPDSGVAAVHATMMTLTVFVATGIATASVLVVTIARDRRATVRTLR